MNGDDFNTIKALFNQYKEHSDEWRKNTDSKLDSIFSKLGKLNCGVHEERMSNMNSKVNALFAIAFAVVCALGALWLNSITK